MSCDDLLRRLAEYSDGALSEALCGELKAHLHGCASCAELERDLQELARLCRECTTPRMPDALRRRLEAKLREAARG
jgi:anti-sigma factor (TIGR02949 family)